MTFLEHIKSNASNGFDAYKCTEIEEAFSEEGAVVFIYAQWSPTAIYCWRILSEVLNGIKDLHLVVYVINADSLDPEVLKQFSVDLPQGKGETFWVRKGKEVSMLASYTEKEKSLLARNTKDLFDS